MIIRKKCHRSISFILLAFLFLAPVHTTFAYLGGQLPEQEATIEEVKSLPKSPDYPKILADKANDKDVNPAGKSTAGVKKSDTAAAAENTADSISRKMETVPPPSVTPSRKASGVPYSSQDTHDLARLVFGEARGEPFTGQVAVAAVVLNRLDSGKFGHSIQQIIYEPGAFTAVSDGQFYLTPDDVAYQAAEAALRGWDPSGGAVYYWNPVTATNKWVWSRTIVNSIGKHVFAI